MQCAFFAWCLVFTCDYFLTLKIRSPDRVSGLNVSQVPFSSNVSIERSNSRERFFDFCREREERIAFSFHIVPVETFVVSFSSLFFTNLLFLFFSPYQASIATPTNVHESKSIGPVWNTKIMRFKVKKDGTCRVMFLNKTDKGLEQRNRWRCNYKR